MFITEKSASSKMNIHPHHNIDMQQKCHKISILLMEDCMTDLRSNQPVTHIEIFCIMSQCVYL